MRCSDCSQLGERELWNRTIGHVAPVFNTADNIVQSIFMRSSFSSLEVGGLSLWASEWNSRGLVRMKNIMVVTRVKTVNTETEMYSFRWNFHHLLYGNWSFWQRPVHPVVYISIHVLQPNALLPSRFPWIPVLWASGLWPDTKNCWLCMRRECRERLSRHWRQWKSGVKWSQHALWHVLDRYLTIVPLNNVP